MTSTESGLISSLGTREPKTHWIVVEPGRSKFEFDVCLFTSLWSLAIVLLNIFYRHRQTRKHFEQD
jgi:hypothetical protein